MCDCCLKRMKKKDKREILKDVDIKLVEEYFISKKKDDGTIKEVLHRALRHFAEMVRNEMYINNVL